MCFLFSMKELTHLKSAQTQVQLQIQVQAQHMDLRREARYTSPISRSWWSCNVYNVYYVYFSSYARYTNHLVVV